MITIPSYIPPSKGGTSRSRTPGYSRNASRRSTRQSATSTPTHPSSKLPTSTRLTGPATSARTLRARPLRARPKSAPAAPAATSTSPSPAHGLGEPFPLQAGRRPTWRRSEGLWRTPRTSWTCSPMPSRTSTRPWAGTRTRKQDQKALAQIYGTARGAAHRLIDYHRNNSPDLR